MVGSLNKVLLIGNLGKDPEIRRTGNGDPVVSFSIATSETWRDKNSGERKEKTEWHNVVVFNEAIAKVCEQYLKKGAKVYIEGALQTRKWEDQAGQTRYATEVMLQKFRGELQMLDKLPSNRPPPAEDPGDYGRQSGRSDRSQQSSSRELDDEIPSDSPESSMKRIRDAQTIIGMLEGGEVAAALGAEITETLAKLKELGGDRPKTKVKGSVTLKLNLEVEAGAVIINCDIDSKRPKPVRGSSFYWVMDDGALSTEHPQQTDMFSGPRERERA